MSAPPGPERHDEWLSAFFMMKEEFPLRTAVVELAERRIALLDDEELDALAAAFELGSNVLKEDLVYAYADMLAERARRVVERKHYLLRYFAQALIYDDPILLYEAIDVAELLFAPEIALASALTAVEMAERYGAVKVAEKAKALVAEMAKRITLEKARRNKWPFVEAAVAAEIRGEGGAFIVNKDGKAVGHIIEGDGKIFVKLLNLHIELPFMKADAEWRSGVELGRIAYDIAWTSSVEHAEAIAIALGFVLEKYLVAKFGEVGEEVVRGLWYGFADELLWQLGNRRRVRGSGDV